MHVLLVASLVAGALSVAAFAVWFGRLFQPTVTDDRRYKDPPPLLWRLTWPLVLTIGEPIAQILTQRLRDRVRSRLRRAALDYALSAEQFVAGQVIAASICAALAGLLSLPRGGAPLWLVIAAALLGAGLPGTWLRDRIETRRRTLLRELPFYLDVITLAVESGLNLSSALAHAVDKGPPGPLRVEFGRVLRDIRAGRSRSEALHDLSARLALPAISSLVAALLVAERQGGALGPVLRAQAEQRRSERFLRAEKLAMEAPVKMLLPLLVFIFPCTFAMLLFPVVVRFLEEGWLR